jgi:hypothetical protein
LKLNDFILRRPFPKTEEVRLPDDESPSKTLKLRYMRGEITKKEYDQMVSALKSMPSIDASSDAAVMRPSSAPTPPIEEQIRERPMAITVIAVLLILLLRMPSSADSMITIAAR